jgi:riboflavin transporter FmnP
MDDKSTVNLRTLTITAILAAISSVLTYLDFRLPFIPQFLWFDFSNLPALIASLAYGPFHGVAIELIKCLMHLVRTRTGGVGELATFITGISLVIPAGLIYARRRTRRGAILGMASGVVIMTVVAVFVNAYALLPFYSKISFIPMEELIATVTVIFPSADSLFGLVMFGLAPFNLIKGITVCLLTYILYKRFSRILHKGQ